MKKDLVFICRKCGHLVFLTGWETEKKMKKMIRLSCPECGEEGYENWILGRFGNFKKEYENKI